MADPGTADWWLSRLYRRLRDRQPTLREWDNWYTGNHPAPQGYEDAEPLVVRILETTGLNMCAVVTDAALQRNGIRGFKIDGKASDLAWDIAESNRFDQISMQVMQERGALSESYMLVDPNENRYGFPTITPEHPEQCIVEHAPGSSSERAAGLKVWQDDTGSVPLVWAMVYLPNEVRAFAAPTRIWSSSSRSALALSPAWEYQPSKSGKNPLGEVSLVPFTNRPRMVKTPVPEFYPAISPQKRINKTLLDRMAMQDQGAFKAMWATGLLIPRDPVTKEPVESFIKAIDRMFINENPAGQFGQLQAEDIKQMLEAVRDDVTDCAMLVPTSPDQIMGKLVNVAADGMKLAQISEVKRVRHQQKYDGESAADVMRLAMRAKGEEPKRAFAMETDFVNPEFRSDSEASDAATKAIANGMPHEAAWVKYYNASGDEVTEWAAKLNERDPVTQALVDRVNRGGNANAS